VGHFSERQRVSFRGDSTESRAPREQFCQVLIVAESFVSLLFFKEFTGWGDLLARTGDRDISGEDLRRTLQVVERWECAYARSLDAWIGAGPWWDPEFQNSFAHPNSREASHK
jgi:hypothetical protein